MNDALDFDDLLTFPLEIFKKKPSVLKKYQKRWKYILVDEYQDTNRAQFQFLTNLASAHENICVVGDDDQSIYGWRGADVSNILEFEKTFSSCKVFKLFKAKALPPSARVSVNRRFLQKTSLCPVIMSCKGDKTNE